MSRRISVLALWLAAILIASLFPLVLIGQEGTKDAREAEHGPKKVTGCLQKGIEPGGFALTGDDGKTWELTSGSSNLADHVGHKVSITGSPIHESKKREEKMETNEKTEAAGKEYADLKVDKVEMISDSCK